MQPAAEIKGICWVLFAALVVPFALYGLGIFQVVHFVAAAIFILYFFLLIVNFEVGFLTLIFLRSSVDYLKNFGGGSVNLAAVISLALIVLGVFYVLYRRVNILHYEESGPFLIFLAVCGLSVIYSPDYKESITDWLRLVSVFSVYILTRIIFTSKPKIRMLFVTILLSSLLPILVALYQLVTGHGRLLDGGQYRIVGTFLHPNAFASYLLILLIFSTALVLERTPFIKRSVLVVLILPIFVIFVFTLSRGAWLVFVVAMLLMGILRHRKILGYLPMVLCGAIFMVPAVRDRIINIFNPGYTHGRSAWEWRVDTWGQISTMVVEKPVFGHGLASVESFYGVLTHNDFLRLAAEVGAVGLLAYLFLAVTLLRKTWMDYRNLGSNIAKSFQLGAFVMIAGFMVRQFADNTLRNTVMMIYFWIFIAISRNIACLYSEKYERG